MDGRIGRRLTAVLVGAGLALLGMAAPAAAAETEARASVEAGRLILDPTERGYRGDMTVTVTNTGTTAASFDVRILEPVAGSFRGSPHDIACADSWFVDNRRLSVCSVPGLHLQPGQQGQFTLSFDALTTIRPYAMRAERGRIEVVDSDSTRPAGRDDFATLFRSSEGSLRHPRPYVQDTEAMASVTAGDATLTRQANGSWRGRMSVTVRYGGDAAHDQLRLIGLGLPEGVELWGTDPPSDPSGPGEVIVPGGRFMAGEERTFDLLLAASADTLPGDLGTALLEVRTGWYPVDVPDADPSDNTTPFRMTAVENS